MDSFMPLDSAAKQQIIASRSWTVIPRKTQIKAHMPRAAGAFAQRLAAGIENRLELRPDLRRRKNADMVFVKAVDLLRVGLGRRAPLAGRRPARTRSGIARQ